MPVDHIENTSITAGDVMPRIVSVEHVQDCTFLIAWSTGKQAGHVDEVDLTQPIMTYKVFSALRGNTDLLKAVSIRNNGMSIGWGTDEHAEMSAEAVYDMREKAERRHATARAMVPPAEPFVVPARWAEFVPGHRLDPHYWTRVRDTLGPDAENADDEAAKAAIKHVEAEISAEREQVQHLRATALRALERARDIDLHLPSPTYGH